MNRRNTLNTRLLPLSILISSLVSGGAMAAAIPIYTKDMQRPTANQYTTAQKSGEFTRSVDAGSIYMDHGPAVNTDTILEDLFPADEQITPEIIAETKLQIEAIKASNEQLIKKFEASVPQLTPEEQKQAYEYLAKLKDAFAKDLKVYETTLAYAEDQSDENKNKLNAAAKDVYVAKLDIIAPGEFTPEEVDLIISASLTKDITALPPALQQKIKVVKQAQLAADKSTQGKLANYLAQDVITQEQKEKLDASFSDKRAKLYAQAEARQAQEVAIKADNKAQADVLRLGIQSVLANTKAENAQKKQEAAETKLARLNEEKATAITAVDSSWTASTLDIENKLQDLIDDSSTSVAKRDLAKTALQAISDAQAADSSAKDAEIKHAAAEKSAQAIEEKYNDAEQAKTSTKTELADKTREFEEATDAVVNLSKVTNPTIDSPEFEQTIAKTEKQTVAADTVAFSTQVAGGTQEVADKGKIIGSIVTNDGSIALAVGAQAIDTQITEGTMSNNGGTDTNTLVGAKGKLVLAGTDAKNIANSINTKVLAGAEVTLSAHSKVSQMVTSGTVKASGNAELEGTTIEAGELSIYDGVIANRTILKGGHFIVEKNGKAIYTTIEGGVMTVNSSDLVRHTTVDGGEFIVNDVKKANTTTLNSGKFTINAGTTANVTNIHGGEFIVNDGATANDTTLNNGEFIVNDGAFADNIIQKGGKFNLMDEAKASKLLVENGYALIAGTLQGAITLNGGTTTFDKTATVSGTIDSGKNSVITLHEGAKTQAADLNLAGNMNLIGATTVQQAALQRSALPNSNAHPAQFAFNDVKLDGGTIDMSANAQLTMASLAGNGNFNLAPSLYNQANAPLNVTGDAAGTFGIQLKDSGVAPTNLNLINVGGDSTARFALSNGPVNLGNYQHNLIPDGKGGFMLKADTTTLTPSTAGVLAVANTMPVIFNAELSSIQNRLDKQSTSANESGVWINYLNDNFDVKGTAANFKQKLNGVTLGGDKAIALGDSVLSLGGFASHSSSDIKSDYQSSGSVESNSLGAYAQYLSNSGYYLNGVLKTNQFKQKLNITSNGNNANGSANFSGLGLAVKAGKHINFDAMYVSPYIALNTFASGKSQYQLSNGMDAQNQGSRNTTGTLGMNTGYRFILNSGAEIKPYAIFSVDRDLKASNNVTINKETFDNSRKGTRVNAGAGINVNMTKNLSVGSEVKLSKGKNISTPVTINLGVGYTF
ncbi:autotransporter outer membrane beta-barrel domain-containing protein [Yersinia aleksiciae]|uniref:Autotransporter domain-containing protein n=2 Tax=Yersinia aleksiciae TaxID=263819 RepID=A0ABM5UAD1_YERAE|nr:autotransporter outer membrane beta-barrel domain-containing protein [Yersinia aleksiciae]AKP32727.1 hypothetical protein ACZ76_03775 [Yersinia aleksiciae]